MSNGTEKAATEVSTDQEWIRRLSLLCEIARNVSISIEDLGQKLSISEEIIRSDIELMKSMSIPLQLTPTDVIFQRGGKPPGGTVWKRRCQIAAKTLSDNKVSVNELMQLFSITKDSIDKDVEELCNLGISVKLEGENLILPTVGVEVLWGDTVIGNRLHDTDSINRKQYLAESVVDYLKPHDYSIKSILIGTGVSAYKVAETIYRREHELHIAEIHSSSVLALFAFAHFRPGMTLKIAGGQLDRTTAWFEGKLGIEYLKEQSIDAIITSFMCLSKKGFTTQQPYEVDEKRMNLRHTNARFCLIPMEWTKLASESGNLITPEKGTGEDILDFLDGRRTYVIFTDVPETLSDDKDKERLDVLDFWENEKGVMVIRLPRPDEISTTK
jgi:DeoR/GlpR family transcriptional regulator of sugar metabolism